MKKIVVVFPGLGYGIDRPLLYYSAKIARERGYEIINIEYSGIDKESLKNRNLTADGFDRAVKQTEEQLAGTDFSACEDIIFISKSIGTVAASVYAAKHDIPARQVYYTPFPQTLLSAQEGNGLVFFGDKDPWVDTEKIRELCDTKKLRYRIIAGGNHSLETGHVHDDVENISDIIHETEEYLVGRPTGPGN